MLFLRRFRCSMFNRSFFALIVIQNVFGWRLLNGAHSEVVSWEKLRRR